MSWYLILTDGNGGFHIRDAILYRFEDLTREEWLKLTRVLAINNIKTTDAPVIGPQSVLSIGQVYDYIASGLP